VISDATVCSSISTPTLEISVSEKAWRIFADDASWKDPKAKEEFQFKHGLKTAEDLCYLDDSEIEELSSLLTTVPYRKFKKLRSE
jgi:hypothetical protein